MSDNEMIDRLKARLQVIDGRRGNSARESARVHRRLAIEYAGIDDPQGAEKHLRIADELTDMRVDMPRLAAPRRRRKRVKP